MAIRAKESTKAQPKKLITGPTIVFDATVDSATKITNASPAATEDINVRSRTFARNGLRGGIVLFVCLFDETVDF